MAKRLATSYSDTISDAINALSFERPSAFVIFSGSSERKVYLKQTKHFPTPYRQFIADTSVYATIPDKNPTLSSERVRIRHGLWGDKRRLSSILYPSTARIYRQNHNKRLMESDYKGNHNV
ncbi:hypothetical protein CDAR_205611 [Caerostris darwini]|uniref:Uncharacterized protein n=1 Tax=Caerostris darwini TaxID=1538125 RepID=A0AAV4WUR8_9ARAC|nr:hypothetical protein CDAR_205611 [Caerostris darwini]